MSIINEALKKAREKNKIKGEESYQEPPLQRPAQDNRPKIKKTTKNKRVVFYPLIYIGVILALAFPGIMIFKNRTATNYPAETTSESIVQTPSVLSKETAATDASGFLLTGIIHGEGAPMAIINGSVYMIGDTIGSARVSKITENSVIMEDNGKESRLKVK